MFVCILSSAVTLEIISRGIWFYRVSLFSDLRVIQCKNKLHSLASSLLAFLYFIKQPYSKS